MKRVSECDMNPEEQLDEIFRRLFKKRRKGMSLYDLILAYAQVDEMGKIEKELTMNRLSFNFLVSALESLTLNHDFREHAKGKRVSDFEKANLIANAAIYFEDGLTNADAWERLREDRPWLKYKNFCKTYVPHAKNAAKERKLERT